VSRNAQMYATTADYELAERRAWERMADAAEAAKQASAN
jgi:hypothetical protein